MELEAGKFYLTRKGLVAFVATIGSPFLDTPEPDQAIGWMKHYGAMEWTVDGRYQYGDTSPHDLVAECTKDGVTIDAKAAAK